MGSKFYAVRKGKKTGIFMTWDECKSYVSGYSGAEYKSFTTKIDAENYLNSGNNINDYKEESAISSDDGAIAYVDGSYKKETKEFSYGAVIFWEGNEYYFSERYDDKDLAEMHNVAGEIKGSERAMQFALENNINKLTIYHDYEGIAKWCTGAWEAKKEGTKAYKKFYESVKEKVHVEFVKVKGHSGDKYNDLADRLAKEVLL